MAKQPLSKSGTSRIRFIMLDAEIPEGDLSQITAAIQNALKPTTIIQQRLPAQAQALASDAELEPFEVEAVEFEHAETSPAPKSPRASKPRKPTTPEVIDLDLTSDVSLASFADEHSSTSEPERYLVIAAWLKEHRDTPTVTTAHIYTCYRSLGWSVAIEDFGWPLRQLKKDKYMASVSRGEFAINHLGIARVNKLGRGG
ncbi:hypothetical protein [Brevundimonas olei]|uniref:hypothetical protein n=1 Tax=Brevundimonas olei TaxID=657642 RepID=UPI0031D4AF6B